MAVVWNGKKIAYLIYCIKLLVKRNNFNMLVDPKDL